MPSPADLAVARHLRRAGQWDLALSVVPADAANLRAEILVDRYLWQLLGCAEAEAAIEAAAHAGYASLAALLRGQLGYWKLLFPAGAGVTTDPGTDPATDLARAARDPRLYGWATFWLGVLADNIDGDRETAAERYARAHAVARAENDRLLASYTARHQGAHLLQDRDRETGIALLRRSLYLRASIGALPQVAAAQQTLAGELAAGPEREALLEAARATARDLRLTWLERALSAGSSP
ncbi:hypothetical protein [Planosporangium mesophilum]|uniref:Uncharacterized protein n=1 Tax=Planosporangium mesophilum TaxID=689768 RepID=A0A8J3T737_9ACTN|nr:hypothetical protein [Planosporangium mesophilum]NJC81455.1 hypothetical protein [Planosporangium mesophilum]GII20888.1 hypothetical protein Pme01_04850 [Planosporangium mesophilum]